VIAGRGGQLPGRLGLVLDTWPNRQSYLTRHCSADDVDTIDGRISTCFVGGDGDTSETLVSVRRGEAKKKDEPALIIDVSGSGAESMKERQRETRPAKNSKTRVDVKKKVYQWRERYTEKVKKRLRSIVTTDNSHRRDNIRCRVQ